MAKPTVLISIETMAETEAKAFGNRFMQFLLDLDPRLEPELVSTIERFKDPYVCLDEFIDQWWAMPAKIEVEGESTDHHFWGPMWKRKSSVISRGMINHGLINTKNQRTASSLWFECQWEEGIYFETLFEKWVDLAVPNIGMLHLFTDAEQSSLQSSAGNSFSVGSFGGAAKPGIPNIGWAMAYGEGYSTEVDVARVGEAGFLVKKIGGVTIVQVTENLSDVIDDFAYFSKRRAELKNLFRPDLFWLQSEPVVV